MSTQLEQARAISRLPRLETLSRSYMSTTSTQSSHN